MEPVPRQGTLWTVGRDFQLRQIAGAWERARSGRGSLVVVAGSAGAGKTHLLEHVASLATDDGATVAWGPCSGADAPPMWAWRRVLDELVPERPVLTVPAEGSDRSAAWADPTARRQRTLTDLVDTLRRQATEHPTLVVLDDFHWADLDSIAALRLVAPELPRTSLLCVVALRPDEPTTTTAALRDSLAELGSGCVRVHLGNLARRDIERLVEHWAGEVPSAETVVDVERRTDGNPLLVRELVGLLMTEGGLELATDRRLAADPLVHDVLLRRVDRRGASARAALDVAAVAGREVGLRALADASGNDPSSLLDVLDDCRRDGLVRLGDDTVAFTHDLLREALYDATPPDHRRDVHARVAAALRAHGGPGSGPAEIAGHLLAAVPFVTADEAAAAALEAGRSSLAAHAPADAARHAARGLAVADRPSSRIAMSLEQVHGEALAALGDREGAVAAFDRAAAVARRLGDADALAAAALGRAGMIARPRTDHELVALLDEAVAVRGDRGDATTARLQARLAHALLFTDQDAGRSHLAGAAVETARSTGDLDALGQALYVWILVHTTTSDFAARRERSEELVAVARRSGDDAIETYALHLHAHLMAEIGDFATFDADVAAYSSAAERIGSATWRWTARAHQAMRATMLGRLADGERLGEEAFQLGVHSQHSVAQAVFGSHLMGLRTWQGRLGELVPAIRGAAGRHRELPAMWASIPYAQAEDGALDEARAELRRLLDDGRFEELPGTHSWPVAVAMLARASALTGAADVARVVAPMVASLGDRHVVGPFGDVYLGPASAYRAMCALAIGDLDDAVDELRDAIDEAVAVGARPVAAWLEAELAVAHHRRGEQTDAARHHGSAVSELTRLGMVRHLDRLAHGFDLPADDHARRRPNAFWLMDGEWHLRFDGDEVTLPRSKGLADLHRLVQSPDVEIHVLELVAGEPAPHHRSEPVLDEQAKREFRRTISELAVEIDDADSAGDIVRAERARLEHDAVVEALYDAVGLSGRDRPIVDEAERARQAVRARVAYAIEKVERRHPPLARHLRNSVVTGLFCCYRPEGSPEWATGPR